MRDCFLLTTVEKKNWLSLLDKFGLFKNNFLIFILANMDHRKRLTLLVLILVNWTCFLSGPFMLLSADFLKKGNLELCCEVGTKQSFYKGFTFTRLAIIKILNLYIIISCTHVYHHSFQYLSITCITCNAFIACYIRR